ncbi:MAG: UDP-N-acetylmuramoyl-L-alanyl-D-glutamate--2,6-diaminopimelate ligase [Calditrichaceae bacterium]|nr:UDP-N-acetylmuramoyl-L-alanyl-D-glutamate--2,6-diaminopimelate ligase [Calditrichaceae bacterium]
MTKTITDLLKNIDAEIPENARLLNINALQFDSRKVGKDDLFFAIPGYKTDGHQYLQSAESSGACAAVVEKRMPGVKIPQIVVKNARQAMAFAAAGFYSEALNTMKLVGITGTNGKTTTSFLIRSILNEAGLSCGLIGTIAYEFGGQKKNAWNTTPEAIDLYKMISQMYEAGQKACVLEVSSHALALQRVAGLCFDAGVFTNLTRDHMDFHPDEEEYFQTKLKLFDLLKSNGKAVVNADDAYGRRIQKEKITDAVSYGFSEKAMIRLLDWKMDIKGMQLQISDGEQTTRIDTKLISKFNTENILASFAAGMALGISAAIIKQGIEKVTRIPGRLEVHQISPGIAAVIDYAHTPDALQKAQEALKALVEKRLIVVFGAGGDRDRGKRPLMGAVVEKLADLPIVTSDNPRTEDPQRIINDVLSGMSENSEKIIIPDRKKAIYEAVKIAQPGDLILIAGKGHETYQEINGKRFDFDDALIVQEAAKNV